MFVINTENGKKNIPKNICQLSNNDGIIETDSNHNKNNETWLENHSELY